MRILVMGGTRFVGRVFVETAVAKGHSLTLFNRGKTNPRPVPNVEYLQGDRNDDLSVLCGRSFEAVVDPSAYFPRQVNALLDVLGDNVGHYVFVSSCSVYADPIEVLADESAPLNSVRDPEREDLMENYGGFKALCEKTISERFPGRVLHARAGLIVGPFDNTGRFGYWVQRFAQGGQVLVPEPRQQALQLLDVRDLATWILHCIETKVVGTFNAVGPPRLHTMESLLGEIHSVTGSQAEPVWVSADFLRQEKIRPWVDLPLWLAPDPGAPESGFLSLNDAKARQAGLNCRPLRETIQDVHAHSDQSHRQTFDYGVSTDSVGLSREKEKELLERWHRARKGALGA